MRLNDETSIFNMGDTSLRVKKQVDMYALLLKHLSTFSYANLTWKDKRYQEEFYKSIHSEIIRLENEENIRIFEHFDRDYEIPSEDKMGKRGRTWTNALVKNGLVTSSRNLSKVGKHYLSGDLKPADKLERLIIQDANNLLYFRQYLKMRIYSHNSEEYFYHFRFAIQFLIKYDNVPKNHFLRIIESIKPTLPNEQINSIICDYLCVKEGKITFDDYYAKHFNHTLADEEEINLAKQMLRNNELSEELFSQCFSNRKSTLTQAYYKNFVKNLIELVDNFSDGAFKEIQFLSKQDKIKKAFGFNQIPFYFKKGMSLNEFLEENKDNPLLNKDHFKIYQQFLASKRFDLIREYADMCLRSFQATGIFNFSQGLVNLNDKWLFEMLLSYLGDRFILRGCSDYDNCDNYEENEKSVWFDDVSLTEILNLNKSEVDEILKNIQQKFNIIDTEYLTRFFEIQKEEEYREFIQNNFPKEVVIDVLSAIQKRDDKQVFDIVTENATIPTIFEYILTIAWFHLSKRKDYELHKSFKLTLDGDKLPLTHRGGGVGDIEIVTKDYALLIEATLMDSNTQKRGELEPVIRHSVNFKLQQNKHKNVQSLFIANELDNNVMNIFRAMQFVKLSGTTEKGEVDGLTIFALTTGDLINILKKDISDDDILSKIASNKMEKPMFIENNWHIPIRNSILSNE